MGAGAVVAPDAVHQVLHGQAQLYPSEFASVAGPVAEAGKQAAKELPDGVLAKAGPAMAAAIGAIAAVAMGEAGWNLGAFVHEILHLPLPLAVGFPVIAEATAASFAVQDLQDRRRGVASWAMRAATYITLAASSIVNGVVGYALHGLGGLLEVVPPLVLGAVIHLHGDRATRAHESRARLSPRWRAQQLRAAQLESVVEVLPLLAGDDPDGQATVKLLRRRLESATLEPGEALIAAGWHERSSRAMNGSRLRRLETVAATVWGLTGPPPPARAAAPSRTPSRAPSATSSVTPSPATSPARLPGASLAPSPEPVSADDQMLADLVAQARRARPGAGEGSVRILLTERGLSASAKRIRAALAQAPSAGGGQRADLHLVDQAGLIDLELIGQESESGLDSSQIAGLTQNGSAGAVLMADGGDRG